MADEPCVTVVFTNEEALYTIDGPEDACGRENYFNLLADGSGYAEGDYSA